MENKNDKIDRREFFKRLSLGGAIVAGSSILGSCGSKSGKKNSADHGDAEGKMTYRVNPSTGDRVSILGYGCMRWPDIPGTEEIDQEAVNRLVDYAIEHGVNYFDTSPAYCRGLSEQATGIALSRHPRESVYIATKLSNFAPETWPFEEGVKMYRNSLDYLQTDYLDYMLLHAIGLGARDLDGNDLSGMEALKARYIDNGLLDFLMAEREAGRIRNLGFSYHGDIEVFDYLLANHDKYHWDFVQIQLNYVDWKHAHEIDPDNTDAEYLYAELQKRDIPAVIMEPLLGGRLARMPKAAHALMMQRRPDDSVASWAFRFAGTPKGVLTVLSGMTYMEHLKDNIRSYSPLQPCTDDELDMLYKIADAYVSNEYVPCTGCKYCMPCPYGIDIPAIFTHFNKMLTEGYYDRQVTDPNYREARRAFLVGYDRSVPKLRQANHCIGCNQCTSHCPQRIKIPETLHQIDRYVEQLKRNNI